MKNMFIILILLFVGVSTSQAQGNWRAINLNASAGTQLFDTDNNFVGGSIGVHWDFNQRYFLSNWNGIHYSLDNGFSDWFASQVTINRNINALGISVGTGIQYRNDLNNTDATFGVISISKTIRLR